MCSGCIVFCIVRITLYMPCRKSVQRKKKKKLKVSDSSYKYVGYGPTQTLTGKLSFYLYFGD